GCGLNGKPRCRRSRWRLGLISNIMAGPANDRRIGLLRSYSWQSLRSDVVAGLTVATVAVPQAMAYALLAGIDPLYGIYTAIVMTALASLFGSSSHLINGPTNAISLVVLGAVAFLPPTTDETLRIQ